MNNEKGFVLSTYIYMLLVFFLLLLTTMLTVMNNTKILSNKLKDQTNNTSGLEDKSFSFVLMGDSDIVLKKGEEYIEPGFKIQTSNRKDLSDIVKIVGAVDINLPNTYKLTYSATYNGVTKKLTRNVTILDNNASNYITWLYNFRKDDNGLLKDDTKDQNIRYAGSINDVKNKVYFNCKENDGINAYGSDNYNYESSCEIWRIIGVFNTYLSKGDTVGVPRIKIVRDALLDTTIAWDTESDGIEGINQWGETTLTSDNTTIYPGAVIKQYLNDGEDSYYNGLSSVAKEQISDVLWYTGAVINDTASVVYKDERSNAVGPGTTVNYTTTWVGKIGLIYASDFAYAGRNCADYKICDYNNDSCGITRNWLIPSSQYYWTITPHVSSNNFAWYIASNDIRAYAYGSDVKYLYGVRPTVYLVPNIQIIGGDGADFPYKLSVQ